jgi:tRNA threonylcarbamoyladenosine biosynthesis protein TsaE
MNDSHETGHTIEFISRSTDQTQQLGRLIARCLDVGDTVGLCGPLGAGKTHLTRGLAEGLGADPRMVCSPTFVLMREYEGEIPIAHVDAYRLDGLSDLASMGWGDELLAEHLTVVEWADRIADEMPAGTLWIDLGHAGQINERSIFIPSDNQWADRLVELCHAARARDIEVISEESPCNE